MTRSATQGFSHAFFGIGRHIDEAHRSSPESARARRRGSKFGATVLTLTLALLGAGCGPKTPYVWSSQLPPSVFLPEKTESQLRAGDTIGVVVEGHDTLNASPVVTNDGYVVLPLVGTLAVAGRTTDTVRAELTRALARSIENPRVSVVLVARRVQVSVLGEVQAPGKYEADIRDGIPAALALAGGLTEFAHEDAIYVVRRSYPKRIRFRLDDLTRGGDSATFFVLRDGDLILVD